jgi:hypothetical protein
MAPLKTYEMHMLTPLNQVPTIEPGDQERLKASLKNWR